MFTHFLRKTHFRCCCRCCCCCVEKARLKLIWACCTALGVGTKYILSIGVFFQIYSIGGCDIRFIITLPILVPGWSQVYPTAPASLSPHFLFPGVVATRYSKFIVNAMCDLCDRSTHVLGVDELAICPVYLM